MNRYALLITVAATVGFALTALAGPFEDLDGDGVADVFDNCSYDPNPDQRDTDGDGFGNGCDCDFVYPPPGDGYVLGDDITTQLSNFNSTEELYDVNGDGFVLGDDVVDCLSRFGTQLN